MMCLLLSALFSTLPAEDSPLSVALSQAGGNRAELEKALRQCPPEEKPGMEFLIANMPDADRKSLKADFLLANTSLAYRARRETPWGKSIPQDLFFNDVLPYAHVDEARDPWRAEFFALCMPMVQGCKTPEEAVRKLNGELFGKLKVKYSTKRRVPNQSARESMELGLASCTGLSIVLADACRAAGRHALVGQQAGQSYLGGGVGRRLALHGRLRAGSQRPRPRLVCGRCLTSAERGL